GAPPGSSAGARLPTSPSSCARWHERLGQPSRRSPAKGRMDRRGSNKSEARSPKHEIPSSRFKSDQMERMLRVGLTGGLASGKSSVAAILRGLGAVVFDADQIVKDLYAPGG